MEGIELRIKGKVQGVGFRPFVWLLANRHNLRGDVNNDGQGVLIRLLAPTEQQLQHFLHDLQTQLPPLALITDIQQHEKRWENPPHFAGFEIRESENNAMDTQIVPDAATCPACLKDLFDPTNRRYHYPFTNCTHCGPRFTIIKAIPYDRKNTSMASFPLCADCAAEYKNPADRRFHAQPNACSVCGPHVWLADKHGNLSDEKTPIKTTVLLLQQGGIIAVKGIGGFHLACDATNANAVQLLRERKRRPTKPLAVMVPDLSFLTELTEAETTLLASTAAPIVLLAKHKVPSPAEQIAPKLNEIGVMLPSNPLQHLLLREANCPLVMTSANPSGQPPILDNESAVQNLSDLADYFLCHNRDILQRADDSLVRAAFDGTETLRRARGYVPDETLLDQHSPRDVLALGSDLKNTFCLLRQNKAIVSQHIGDTANEKVRSQLEANIALFCQIYQFKPELIAIDAHAGYFTHEVGKRLATQYQIPYVQVLHHHAHIVSVMAEHHCHEQVIGLALDGIGMGENGQLWGGECLLADEKSARYLGGLPAVALPGGDLAAKQPWRNWLAHLQQFVPNWRDIVAQTCADNDWQLLATAIERQLNSPPISSAGRLFDAVAFGLGITPPQLSWEGEAACQLEVLAEQSELARLPLNEINLPTLMPLNSENKLDLAVFWQTWLAFNASAADKAFIFHYALAEGFATLARQQAERHRCKTVVLSGGVWHNRLLRRLTRENLTEFKVLSAHQFPMGDGGLSLGQAVIASQFSESKTE
ncbi:HypF protein [Aggregatibacter actinomycetemcomitans serotype e str. SC1083]|uniref:Carbamoyltransferase HypF n=1 Tax=Aggregatibacter actinomycetemcomitans serotype e str. SC1083 TaxID=907488 RepID=G4A6T5_AGGAC|nr:carbamoyltransferase HypF [Aggregatibacter actinomycetemcomitans]EGY34139.1 HypF protein [Aggregatibacter actinomycetemcomitans serotype e str. SC1083]KYK72841.1 hydrogenase maturation protein HypF [Aggregatibacter actinomycetemcomitans serotype e str. SA3096]KYK81364.1 hydrogenase maturation protein HypF [Aggregatibacter actinomycetemcomitans serotype e str. SC936]KYK96527.1 hydrogenase maturation protein HypF [Aggregatibacter actinomycetemcomitans serotype e str. ANH9776]